MSLKEISAKSKEFTLLAWRWILSPYYFVKENCRVTTLTKTLLLCTVKKQRINVQLTLFYTYKHIIGTKTAKY